MIDSHEFPTELPADPEGGAGALRWTAGVIALTAFALALFNAEVIADWTQDLSPGPRTARVMTAADGWKAATARLGLDAPHAGLHRVWKRAEALAWRGDRGAPAPLYAAKDTTSPR